jgi:hypothetical protein
VTVHCVGRWIRTASILGTDDSGASRRGVPLLSPWLSRKGDRDYRREEVKYEC